MDIEKKINLRDSFVNYTFKDKEIIKAIKKEAEKESVDIDDQYFHEWFIFEKTFNENQNCLNIFEKHLENNYEKTVVKEWNNFIFSIFKVKKEDEKNYAILNMSNNKKYYVYKNSTEKNLKVGDHIITRLLPTDKDQYIFSNIIYQLAEDKNTHIQNIVAQFELDYPQSAFLDNKNKMESSYRIQAVEYEDFVEFFGNDEIIVKGEDISQRLKEFYHYRYFQKKDKESGKTIAKIFREKYGVYPELPMTNNFPSELISLEEVGIIYDREEGLNFLPWYGVFCETFINPDSINTSVYKECVILYLKSESISTLPFKKVVKKYPDNFIKVFKYILDRKRFNLPEDYNKLMEKYKISFINRIHEPSVIPMPEKAKALLRTKRPEEYGSINLYKGPNRYHDINKNYKIKM